MAKSLKKTRKAKAAKAAKAGERRYGAWLTEDNKERLTELRARYASRSTASDTDAAQDRVLIWLHLREPQGPDAEAVYVRGITAPGLRYEDVAEGLEVFLNALDRRCADAVRTSVSGPEAMGNIARRAAAAVVG